MSEPVEIHGRFPFEDGRSAELSMFKSERGSMVLVTRDGVNPFNHGDEHQAFRTEIAEHACKQLQCPPESLIYIEQVGQHYQSILFERAPDGGALVKDGTHPEPEPSERIEAMIDSHQSIQADTSHLHLPNYHEHLELPDLSP